MHAKSTVKVNERTKKKVNDQLIYVVLGIE